MLSNKEAGLLCLQIKCPCGYYGTTTNEKAISQFSEGIRPRLRCSRCKGTQDLEIRMAWNPSASALDGCRTEQEHIPDGLAI